MEELKKWGGDIVLSCLSILLGVKPIMVTIGILLFFDFLTGVWSSIKNGEEINSKRMGATVTKMILYQMAILSAFLVEKFIITQLPLTELVAGFLSLIELKSISENVFKITGINFFSSIKNILTRNGDKIGIDQELVKNIDANLKQKENETV